MYKEFRIVVVAGGGRRGRDEKKKIVTYGMNVQRES